MVVLNAVQSVLSIVIMIGLGYILTLKKWFDDSTAVLFSRLVVNISLPAMMVSNIMTTFDIQKLKDAGYGLIIPFLSMLIGYVLAVIASRLIRIRQDRRGLFQTMFFVSNTIFIGMPVNISLFGDESIPFVLLFYIANTALFWTLGISRIKKDGGNHEKTAASLNTLKKIFSPPLMGFLIAIILLALQLQLPKFIMEAFKYIGNLTTPLSLLFIGITFHSLDIKKIRLTVDMGVLLAGRFIAAPIIVYGLSLLFPIPPLMTKVFIVQASMPVIMQAAITSKAYGADYEYATVMVTVTTIASLIFIPIYMVLLSGL